MKAIKLSTMDIVRIRLCLFFGTARWLSLDEAVALYRGCGFDSDSQGRKKNPVIEQLGLDHLGWPMLWKLHSQWVSLATTEGCAKDAFFSGPHRGENSSEQENQAVAKWLEFLNDPTDDYHLNMVWKLERFWTSQHGEARKLVNQRRREFSVWLQGRSDSRRHLVS